MEEGGLVLALRDFVEDGTMVEDERRKECHFRSHDTTGPAGHFALFLFSARRARPDLPTSPPPPRRRLSLSLSRLD